MFTSSKTTRLIIAVIALVFISSTAEARHLKLYTYDVLDKGHAVLTYTIDVISVPGGDKSIGTPILHEIEFEYGITSKWTQSLYVDYDQLGGKVNEVTALKTEFNYAFSEKGRHFVDFRLNIEYAMAVNNNIDAFNSTDTPDTIEFRPIFEKNFKKFTLIIGPILLKELTAPNNATLADWNFGFANAVMINVTERVGFNLELHSFMGESRDLRFIKRQSHYLVPNIDFAVTEDLSLGLGGGIGLTSPSDNFTLRFSTAYSF